MKNIVTCTCCQAEITAPQYYNGKPYGYSCVKKVSPNFKRKKNDVVVVEFVKLVSPIDRTCFTMTVKINNRNKSFPAYGNTENDKIDYGLFPHVDIINGIAHMNKIAYVKAGGE